MTGVEAESGSPLPAMAEPVREVLSPDGYQVLVDVFGDDSRLPNMSPASADGLGRTLAAYSIEGIGGRYVAEATRAAEALQRRIGGVSLTEVADELYDGSEERASSRIAALIQRVVERRRAYSGDLLSDLVEESCDSDDSYAFVSIFDPGPPLPPAIVAPEDVLSATVAETDDVPVADTSAELSLLVESDSEVLVETPEDTATEVVAEPEAALAAEESVAVAAPSSVAVAIVGVSPARPRTPKPRKARTKRQEEGVDDKQDEQAPTPDQSLDPDEIKAQVRVLRENAAKARADRIRAAVADRAKKHGGWWNSALCIGVDPEKFFPVSTAEAASEEAISICRTCVVREQCLEYALRTQQQHGVWGGLSQRSLNAIYRSRNQAAKKANKK